MLWGWSAFVLERRINRPLVAVERVVCDPSICRAGSSWPLGSGGSTLRLDRSFGVAFPPFGVERTSWVAPATVARGGRALIALELEINVWAAEAIELVVRPRARHPQRWGGRKLRRYFDMAHASADLFTRVITEVTDEQRVAISDLAVIG